MNIAFLLILLASIFLVTINSPESVMGIMLEGINNSAVFAVKLFAIYSIWLSILKILEKAKADRWIAKKLKKPIQFLFKNENEKAYSYISMNLSANMLGMGGACTPMGIKSIENMQIQKNKIMLVVINSTSIQLIPTTVVAMRASLQSVTDIIIPSLIATFCTTFIGIVLVKIFVK